MAGNSSAPTISLRERSFRMNGPEEKLSKWLVFSLFTHGALIAIPRNVVAYLEPLGVLIEHRVDQVDKRLVA